MSKKERIHSKLPKTSKNYIFLHPDKLTPWEEKELEIMVFSLFKQRNATLITSWPIRAFLPYINLGQFYCSRAIDYR